MVTAGMAATLRELIVFSALRLNSLMIIIIIIIIKNKVYFFLCRTNEKNRIYYVYSIIK